MSIQALKDAFVAGWNAGRMVASQRMAEAAFDHWYQNALAYLDRNAVPSKPAQTKDTTDYEGIV